MSLRSILEKAKELERQGTLEDYKKADDILSKEITKLENSRRPDIARLFNQRGLVRRMQKRYDDSFNDYEAALGFNTENEEKALALINMADIYRVARNDMASAHTTLDEALTYAGTGNVMHAKAVDQRGLVFLAKKEYDSSIASHKKARDICEKILEKSPDKEDAQKVFGQSVHHLGVTYVAANYASKAEEAYESQVTAFETFKRLGDQQGMVNAITTMGKISMMKNNSDEAITQYEKAWEILQKTQYGRAITTLALNLAEAYLKKKDSGKANLFYQRAFQGLENNEVTQSDRNLLCDQIERVLKEYDNQIPELGIKKIIPAS